MPKPILSLCILYDFYYIGTFCLFERNDSHRFFFYIFIKDFPIYNLKIRQADTEENLNIALLLNYLYIITHSLQISKLQ